MAELGADAAEFVGLVAWFLVRWTVRLTALFVWVCVLVVLGMLQAFMDGIVPRRS